jgi:TctA family transporter
LAIFIEQPISAALLLVAGLLVLSPALKWLRRTKAV